MMLDDEQLKAIRKRCEKATPEPWGLNSYDICALEHRIALMYGTLDHGNCVESDANFIVHAREDIPVLLDALEEAFVEVQKYIRERNQADLERLCAFTDRDRWKARCESAEKTSESRRADIERITKIWKRYESLCDAMERA